MTVATFPLDRNQWRRCPTVAPSAPRYGPASISSIRVALKRGASVCSEAADPPQPAAGSPALVALVEGRHDLARRTARAGGGVALVLGLMVDVDVAGQRPAVLAVIGLGPPPVEDAQLQTAVDADFIPLVPLASRGGRGRFSQTSHPRTRLAVRPGRSRPGTPRAGRRSGARLRPNRRCSTRLASSSRGWALPASTDLHRAVAAQQRQRPFGVTGQQLQALVSRHPPREADREHVGVERLGGGADILGGVAASRRSVVLRWRTASTSVGPLARRARPELGVGDPVDRRPRRGVAGARHPVLAEVAVEQLAHRCPDPGRDVHAVSHIADRDLVQLRARATAGATSRGPPRRGDGSRRWRRGSCAAPPG